MCSLRCRLEHLYVYSFITSLLSVERWRVFAGVCVRRPRADRSVEGRAGEQRPLVCHASRQPAAGPPDFRVHGCLRGQIGVHSDLSGRNRARGTAGPDSPSNSEQDAASWDSECHAGERTKGTCGWTIRPFPYGFDILVYIHWFCTYLHSLTVSPPVSVVSDHGVRPPGSLPAGASAGVSVQPARTNRETCPGVRHDRVDEQAAPLLRTVRG